MKIILIALVALGALLTCFYFHTSGLVMAIVMTVATLMAASRIK